MSHTVTYNPESGESVVETRGGKNIGHAGVTAGGRDEFTGEYLEPQFEQDFATANLDALPPEYRQSQTHTPITDDYSSAEDVARWLQTPGEISQEEINTLVAAWDANGTPGHERDTLLELLSYKNREVAFSQLSEEALEMLGLNLQEAQVDAPENADLDELQASLSPEDQQKLERMDDSSYEDLQVLVSDALSVQQDPGLVDEQRQQAEQLYKAGDFGGALMSELSAQVHEGQLTAADAIRLAVGKMGMKDAIDCYSRLQYGYSATGNNISYGRN